MPEIHSSIFCQFFNFDHERDEINSSFFDQKLDLPELAFAASASPTKAFEELANFYILLCLSRTFLEFKADFYRSGGSFGKKYDWNSTETEKEAEAKAEKAAEAERVYALCLNKEFKQLKSMSDFFRRLDKKQNQSVLKKIKNLELSFISSLGLMKNHERLVVLQIVGSLIEKLFLGEANGLEALASEFAGSDCSSASLYNSFDSLDSCFGISYLAEADQVSTERIFLNSGALVQTSYSNIFAIIRKIEMKSGMRFVDLGCGFGRWGFVLGLLRNDLLFEGYEFVESRVNNSKDAKRFLGLGDQVQFYAQDLSLSSFVLPEADIFYMYDPFTWETYDLILKQIVQQSKSRKIQVVTKGHAYEWFEKNLSGQSQSSKIVAIDGGNLHLITLG